MKDNQESKKGTRRTWVELDMDVWKKLSQLAKRQDRSPSWMIQSAVRGLLGFPQKP